MERFRLAIVIPAYNEEKTIARQVDELSKIGEVIVVNDGSTDFTAGICAKLDCTLINLPNNFGYDLALETGIRASLNYDFVITTDADGEIPTASVLEVFEKLKQGFDCVIGTRKYFPRFSEGLVNRITRIKFRVDDILCGLKGYRTSEFSSEIKMRSSVGTLLALNMLRAKKRITFVKVDVKNRNGESRFGRNDLRCNLRILRVLTYV